MERFSRLVSIAMLAFVFFCGGVAYAANTRHTNNDHVLSGDKGEFQEYFKTDNLSCNKSDWKN